MAEKLNPFNKPLKAEVQINITSELKEAFDSVNKALSDACELALKQPIPGKQLVLMTDANFRSAGHALMVEDNPDQKKTIKEEDVCTYRIWIKNILPPRSTKNVHLLEKIFGNLHGIPRVCTYSVGNIKTDDCLNGQQISYPFLPDKSHSTIPVERMWLCAAV